MISAGDNLVESQNVFSDEVMASQILRLIIVTVKDLDLILLILLEMELNIDFLNPLRIEIVMDDFCLTKFIPHIALLLEKYDERI